MNPIDEHLRAALRHAPDAELQAPAALSARILAQARATAQTAPPRRRRISPVLALLGQPGLLGLAALAGLGALWLLARGPNGVPEPAPQLAQVSPASPVIVAERREAAPEPVVEVAKPAAPPARRRPAAVPAQVAAATQASQIEPAEPVRMAAAPPPAAEFKPAPPSMPAPVAAAVAAAPALAQASANPLRTWLATAEAPAPAWLLAMAEASEGRWRDETAPALALKAEPLSERARLRSALADAASAPHTEPLPRLLPLQIGERRASLLLKPEGLRWCEGGRCQSAALSPEELSRLQALLPPP